MSQAQTQNKPTTVVLGSGYRKYTPIWRALKEKGVCVVKCTREDTLTVYNGVRKEKVRDSHKPKARVIETEMTEDGIIFRLVEDTSINNL